MCIYLILKLFYFRYLDKEGVLFSQFLDLVPLPDGKADTIVTAIHKILDQKGIPKDKIFGLGTDGAAVMTGIRLLDLNILFFSQLYPQIFFSF